jgi:hypothetical protein
LVVNVAADNTPEITSTKIGLSPNKAKTAAVAAIIASGKVRTPVRAIFTSA